MFNTKDGKWIVWFGILTAIIAVFMLVSNRGNIGEYSRYIPYGLFLVCPIAHLFMMNMHKGTHNQEKDETKDKPSCH